MKYRKRPIVVEAYQMTLQRRQDDSGWPEWLRRAWDVNRDEPGSLHPTVEGIGDGTLSITTLEGEHLVSWDDYIIRGVQGEIYPCKPGIFKATYECIEQSRCSGTRRPAMVPDPMVCPHCGESMTRFVHELEDGSVLICWLCACEPTQDDLDSLARGRAEQ